MKIKVMSLPGDDHEKALQFPTNKLGFVKKSDFTHGSCRWLTVVSAEEPAGGELGNTYGNFIQLPQLDAWSS